MTSLILLTYLKSSDLLGQIHSYQNTIDIDKLCPCVRSKDTTYTEWHLSYSFKSKVVLSL